MVCPMPGVTGVGIVASDDMDGDSVADTSLEFEIGTSEVYDEGEINRSDAAIALSSLAHDFGVGAISPIDVDMRVKAIHKGKKGGENTLPARVDCGV
jgi:hypothetical protein